VLAFCCNYIQNGMNNLKVIYFSLEILLFRRNITDTHTHTHTQTHTHIYISCMYVTKPCVRHGVDKTYEENFNRKSKYGNKSLGTYLHSSVIFKWIMGKYNMKVD
jgi:hypothetical protein